MSLELDLGLRRGAFELELRCSVAAGEVLAIVGPNGAGKSTLLAAIAGLSPLSRGEIVLEGRVLERVSEGLRVPPQDRDAGVLFQGLALFDHLDVLDNIAYGPRARGMPRAKARARALRWLERLGIEALSARRPPSLSGGEAQRVALARALIVEPRILLLDEPLAALDAAVALEARTLLAEVLAEFEGVSVVVTHELADAEALADRVLVLEAGRSVASGSPAQVFGAAPTAHLRAMRERLLPSRRS